MPQVWWLVFAPLLLLFKTKNFTSLILVCLFGIGLGLWRGGVYMQKLQVLQQNSLQIVTIQATATSDSFYGKKSQVQFTANNLKMVSPKAQPLAGSFKLSALASE